MNTMDIALVYMVAGLSSRFQGKVKQFAKVGKNGETLIEASLNQALPAGFTKIIFVVGEKTEDLFMEKFGEEYKGIPVYYTFQEFNKELRDRPWGTTDALCTIKEIIDCPFVVCNGDDIYGKNSFQIVVDHLKNPKNKGVHATIGYKLDTVLPESGTVNRGLFEINPQGYVEGIVETLGIERKDLDDLGISDDTFCSMNLFGFFPEIIDGLCEILEDFKKKNKGDRKKECFLPKDVSQLIQEKKLKLKVYSTPDKWLGLTNPEDEEKLKKELDKL
jgi:NDP-sugar pyrophosphorylase family protein